MSSQTISANQLLTLRTVTQALAQRMLFRLRNHLDALAPLLRPRRFLGDHMEGGGREAVAGADGNLAELRDLYRKVALKPFDLRPELPTPLESITTVFQLHEWEYLHPTQTDRGWQSIRVSSPLTWVLTYSSPYSIATLRDVIGGAAQRDPEAVRAFVLRACVMHELLRKTPGITTLLSALRYKVEVKISPQFGELPFVTISAPFRTLRPADDMVAIAAGMAGTQAFTEVLEVNSVEAISDPLKTEALEILEQHKIEI